MKIFLKKREEKVTVYFFERKRLTEIGKNGGGKLIELKKEQKKQNKKYEDFRSNFENVGKKYIA